MPKINCPMRNRRAGVTLFAAISFTAPFIFANAHAAEVESPESVGMSSAALNVATESLQRHIDEGDIAGVVAAVARDGKLVYQVALGNLDKENGIAMREDALFRIYSMSREITSVAALRLYEARLD